MPLEPEAAFTDWEPSVSPPALPQSCFSKGGSGYKREGSEGTRPFLPSEPYCLVEETQDDWEGIKVWELTSKEARGSFLHEFSSLLYKAIYEESINISILF